MFLIFINIEIVGKLKYAKGLCDFTEKWTSLYVFIVSIFCKNIYFNEHLIESAFETAFIVSEIQWAHD